MRIGFLWSFKNTEVSNYYYSLTPSNRNDLISLISLISSRPFSTIEEYFIEIESDNHVKKTLEDFRDSHSELKDSNLMLGRRLGWYALIRVSRPKLVVETGVHHGVGGLVIQAALKRNQSEGFDGSYIGTDINENAGILFRAEDKSFARILYGDSIESLKKLGDGSVDFFINDSDHSARYEADEYEVMKFKASSRCIFLGDNSHESSALYDFSRALNRSYAFFKEMPLNHFYPGAGIGISIPRDCFKS